MERPIAELNEKGDVLRCFANITSASEHLGMCRARITSRCNGLTKSEPLLKWYYDVPYEERIGVVKMQKPSLRGLEPEISRMERELATKLINIVKEYKEDLN